MNLNYLNLTSPKMSSQYVCESCNKEFKRNCDLSKHKNRKTPCGPPNTPTSIKTKVSTPKTPTVLNELFTNLEYKNDNKGKLKCLFDYCLNILRNNEHLIGDKALRTLARLIVLKLIEPQINNGVVDIDTHSFSFEHIEDTNVENHRNTLLHYSRFSNLSKLEEVNLYNVIKYLWDDILSKHPKTKNIFIENENFGIKASSTFKRLIDKLNEFNFNDVEEDVLGEAYEEVVKSVLTGKTLGQFFTPPEVKKMMVKLINPQIKEDGTIETIFDPAMGTGGFLITCLRHLSKQSKQSNIKLDWEFIRTKALGGREAEPDTYQLAVSNMLISSGQIFDSLEQGDSIRNPIMNKYDIIMANPPFGIKGLNYNEFNSSFRDAYLPISSDNAVTLFLQAMIYMLKIGGRCAVVLPDGQDLFSKSGALVTVREFLMKTCDLKEVIYLPNDTFTHTSIKTCIFYFVKKFKGSDILEIKNKTSRTVSKKVNRDYTFSKEHATEKVDFCSYNVATEEKTLIVSINVDDIAKNNYSLNYNEYMKDTKEENFSSEVEIKTLGEVCEITYGTRIVKNDNEEGEYPVYGSGRATFTTNKFNRENFNILIGRFALSEECVRLTNEKLFLNDSGLTVKPLSPDNYLLHKYIAYYLFCNQNIIYDCARGTAQKNIDMDKLKSIKIPVPSLEVQNKIVKYLDFIYEKAIKTSNEKITELKMMNEFCLNNQSRYGINEIKTLGEICSIEIGGTPSRNINEYYENGTNLWVSVKELNNCVIFDTKEKITEIGIKNSSVKLFNTNTILFSFKLSIGKVGIVGTPLYTNEAIAGINTKDESILLNKYLYYHLLLNDFTKLGSGIIGNGSLNKKSLAEIKIPVPPLNVQNKFIKYCEFNDTLIKQLEKDIENNKTQAQEFLSCVLKTKISTEEQDYTNTVNDETSNEVHEEE